MRKANRRLRVAAVVAAALFIMMLFDPALAADSETSTTNVLLASILVLLSGAFVKVAAKATGLALRVFLKKTFGLRLRWDDEEQGDGILAMGSRAYKTLFD